MRAKNIAFWGPYLYEVGGRRVASERTACARSGIRSIRDEKNTRARMRRRHGASRRQRACEYAPVTTMYRDFSLR